MKKLLLPAVIATTLGAAVNTSIHAALASNSVLDFNSGSPEFGTLLGSYFGLDFNGDGTVDSGERVAISPHNGLVLGTIQIATGSHDGPTDGSESPDIDNPWQLFGFTGMHGASSATTVTSTGVNTASIDFSGWYINWAVNGVTDIGLGNGGAASVICAVDCTAGDSYTLDYSTIIASDDPSGFGDVLYNLHMEGTFSTIPIPAAIWLFGSGLIGLVGMARRKA